MNGEQTHQELISDFFKKQAKWRSMKAREYPDDEDRNLNAAFHLMKLASHVTDLPADDWRVEMFADFVTDYHDHNVSEELIAMVGRIGFNDLRGGVPDDYDTDKNFTRVAEVLARDYAQEAPELPTERDLWVNGNGNKPRVLSSKEALRVLTTRKRGWAAQMVDDFLASGDPGWDVADDIGPENFASSYQGLLKEANRTEGVRCARRGDHLYLLRTDLGDA